MSQLLTVSNCYFCIYCLVIDSMLPDM